MVNTAAEENNDAASDIHYRPRICRVVIADLDHSIGGRVMLFFIAVILFLNRLGGQDRALSGHST